MNAQPLFYLGKKTTPKPTRAGKSRRCPLNPLPCGAICLRFSPPLCKYRNPSVFKELLSKTIGYFGFFTPFFPPRGSGVSDGATRSVLPPRAAKTKGKHPQKGGDPRYGHHSLSPWSSINPEPLIKPDFARHAEIKPIWPALRGQRREPSSAALSHSNWKLSSRVLITSQRIPWTAGGIFRIYRY